MQRTLRQSRVSGNLNLSAKELTEVPKAVLHPINYMELDENLWECRDLYKLDLSYNDLVTIPKEIDQLKALSWFKIKQNQISQVPNELGKLQSLVYLDLSNNKLSQLPACLVDLVRLRELYLGGNMIDSLPSNIGSLTNLETFSIEQNSLTSLPSSIDDMIHLRTLHAQENRLITLPSAISSMTTLETLDLSENSLHSVPSLELLNRLKFLDLRRNKLTVFPTVSTTSRLDQLFLGHNQLTDIPIDQMKRLASSLTVFDVRCNKLAYIPLEIAEWSQLKSFDVSNNELNDLPNGLGFIESLNYILIEGNPLRQVEAIRQTVVTGGCVMLKKYLKSRQAGPPVILDSSNVQQGMPGEPVVKFPEHLIRDAMASCVLDLSNQRSIKLDCIPTHRLAPTLLHLNISRNGLESLPLGLAALTSLQTLTAEDNHLNNLPTDIAHIPRLRALRLQRNHLTDSSLSTVLDGSASIRLTLHELDLRHNQLTEIPSGLESYKALDTLLLSFNQLTTLPINWRSLTKLTTFLVDNNQLESIGTIYEAPVLTSLNVENNKLQQIPSELGRCTYLRLLSIQGNPQRQIRYPIIQRGANAVIQYLREQLEPVPGASLKRMSDDTAASTQPRSKRQQVEESTPIESLTLEELTARIKAGEEQLDQFGLSNFKETALKRELAQLRAARMKLER